MGHRIPWYTMKLGNVYYQLKTADYNSGSGRIILVPYINHTKTCTLCIWYLQHSPYRFGSLIVLLVHVSWGWKVPPQNQKCPLGSLEVVHSQHVKNIITVHYHSLAWIGERETSFVHIPPFWQQAQVMIRNRPGLVPASDHHSGGTVHMNDLQWLQSINKRIKGIAWESLGFWRVCVDGHVTFFHTHLS